MAYFVAPGILDCLNRTVHLLKEGEVLLLKISPILVLLIDDATECISNRRKA